MFLYANGCSMTYGSELVKNSDSYEGRKSKYRVEKAWPNQLANLLEMAESFNHGKAGGSNERILRTTIEWISEYLNCEKNPKDLFVVIGWSAPSRYEIQYDNGWVDIHPHSLTDFSSETLKKIAEFYGKYITNIEVDIIKTMTYILSLQSWLKVNNIPYLFFNALPIFHNEISHLDQVKKQIDKTRYYGFDNTDIQYMHKEIGIEKLPLGPGQHPLEKGHFYWAEKMYSVINENKLMVL